MHKKSSTITNIICLSLFLIFLIFLICYYFITSFLGRYTRTIRTYITLPQLPVYNFVVFAHHTESHTSFEHFYCEINFSQGIYKKKPLF